MSIVKAEGFEWPDEFVVKNIPPFSENWPHCVAKRARVPFCKVEWCWIIQMDVHWQYKKNFEREFDCGEESIELSSSLPD